MSWFVNVLLLFSIFISVRKADKHDLRPTLALSSLQLRNLCEEDELRDQLRNVRFGWLTCLGIRKLFMPAEVDNLSEMDRLKLAQMLAVPYESINPYCLLAERWRSCSRHLSGVSCLIANVDAIESAGNPKYTPLHRPIVKWRRRRTPTHGHELEYVAVPMGATSSEHIDRQEELYRVHCETVRTQQHYRNSAHGAASSQAETSSANLANQFGHLFTVAGSESDADDLRLKSPRASEL